MVCLRALRLIALVSIASLIWAQVSPTSGTETVAKPKNSSSTDAPAPDTAPIPTKFSKKDVPQNVPVFSTDALTVSVDVAVLDNKDHFIPKLPKNYFRVLEDNVPQQIKTFSLGEAPMTITMVIEFSALFQQYYADGWFQTLNASYGFLQTLKPEDYVAVVAYDLKPEILSDFSVNRQDAYEAMQRLRIPGFREPPLRRPGRHGQPHAGYRRTQGHPVISSGVDTLANSLTIRRVKRFRTTACPSTASACSRPRAS